MKTPYPDKDESYWTPTNEVRVIPLEGYDLTLWRSPTSEEFMHGTATPKYRFERLWIRVWAEKEWRAE